MEVDKIGAVSPRVAGLKWEDLFASEATKRGLSVIKTHHNCPYDLVCNGWRTQCKATDFVDRTSRPARLRISRGSSCRSGDNYAVGDFDVFAILFRSNTYIVPASAVGSRDGQMKRRLSIAKLMRFKDNWEIFDGAGSHLSDSQMELF